MSSITKAKVQKNIHWNQTPEDFKPGDLFCTSCNRDNVWLRTEYGILSLISNSGPGLSYINIEDIDTYSNFLACKEVLDTTVTIRGN